ncbi:MAG: hypothetical protein CVT48_02835 [Thermoplasmata archaeon HGW-Thermoplasmata-1]|nr:MAG: hypothetical protein CVT48_02835 [Thermoplasmata archaeon HGW-Thermoplasmata-1]
MNRIHKKMKPASLVLAAAFAALTFSGCIGTLFETGETPPVTEDIPQTPVFGETNFMQRIESVSDRLIIVEKIPELAPITAPLCVRHSRIEVGNDTVPKVEVTPAMVGSDEFAVRCMMEQLQPADVLTIGDVSVQGTENIAGDLTEISIEVAKRLENPKKVAIIFENYALGLAAVPLACYLNAPLVYAETLEEVNNELLSLGVKEFITLGWVKGGHTHLNTREELYELFLDRMAENGDYCDYAVVVNAYDAEIEGSENKFPQDCLSMSGAFLAAYRNALLVVTDFEPNEAWKNEEGVEIVKAGVTGARIRILKHGMIPKYICLVGDPRVMPMKYYADCGTGEWAEEEVPTDNYYADFDGNPLTQEMSIGRIVGRNAGDASALVARSMGYQRMVDLEKEKDDPTGLHVGSWIKNAYFIEGTLQIEIFSQGDVTKVNQMLTEGGFITKFRHSALGALSSQDMDIYDNNYLIYYGHGGDDGWYYFGIGGGDALRVGPEDLEEKIIPPGNGIAGSCLTSALDSMSEYAKAPIDQRISLAFLHSGCLSYLGGTRVTWGEVKIWPAMESSCNGLLCNRYIENLVRFNQTLGDALAIAKNEYYKVASSMERTTIYVGEDTPTTYQGLTPWDVRTILAYPLYGDPAANPCEYPPMDVILG